MTETKRLTERVLERVRGGRDELTGLLGDLIACDTTAREPGDPARDEAKLQEDPRRSPARARGRGRAVGARAVRTRRVPGHPLRARFQRAPTAGGQGCRHRRRAFAPANGHIDAVPPGDLARWESHPFAAEVRDGHLYGRGASDMKGAIAAFVYALECLRAEGVRLRGDVIVAANSEEESSGSGSLRVAQHGVRADAGICGEPTGFDVWVACRGSLAVRATVPGRTGHAEMPQAGWREGGAVNAIEKLEPVLGAVRALREDWRTRADGRHPLLSPPDIVPTLVRAGEWTVTYPDVCVLTCDAQYLPLRVGPAGYGKDVRDEIDGAAARRRRRGPLAGRASDHHRVHRRGGAGRGPRRPRDRGARAGGRKPTRPRGQVSALDSWHDAATFTRFGTPTVSLGPAASRRHTGRTSACPCRIWSTMPAPWRSSRSASAAC